MKFWVMIKNSATTCIIVCCESGWWVDLICFHRCWHSTRLYLVAAVIQDFAGDYDSTGIGRSWCSDIRVSNWRFVDDISLFTESNIDLQTLVDKVYSTSGNCELVGSSTKTQVQYIGREQQQMTSSWEMAKITAYWRHHQSCTNVEKRSRLASSRVVNFRKY